MRKVFWSCCATAVVTATVVALASEYVHRHPETWLGQCYAAVRHIGTVYNPVTALSSGLASKAIYLMKTTSSDETAGPSDEEVCLVPPEPRPIASTDLPSEDDSALLQPIDVVDLAKVGPVQGEAESAAAPVVPTGFAADAPEQACKTTAYTPAAVGIAAGPLDRSEDQLAFMPRCEDDLCDLPARMPYAEDSIPLMPPTSWFRFWKAFREHKDAKPSATSVPGAGLGEETEISKDGTPPPCQVDPAHNHQYPGCPYLGGPSSCPCPVPAPPPAVEPQKEQPPSGADSAANGNDGKIQQIAEKARQIGQARVDTTEYRPTDALRPDEFDPAPY